MKPVIGYKVGDRLLCVGCAGDQKQIPIFQRKTTKLNCDECKRPLTR